MADVDAVFEQIRDLAAVRVATYEQRHEDQVVSTRVPGGSSTHTAAAAVHERKDKNRQRSQQLLPGHPPGSLSGSPADIVGTYANVTDVPCEIQVCSMMAHVWNEIEHDLGYKPAAGVLSEQERNFLTMLGQSVRMGDGTIASLFAETERRQTRTRRRVHGRVRLCGAPARLVPGRRLRPTTPVRCSKHSCPSVL